MNDLSNEMIALLNKKQEAAFEIMFKLYYPRLVWFAKEYVPYQDAKSLVQDAFITFWERNPIVSNESQLQSYIYTLVKNNCLMFLRHEKVKKGFADETGVKMQNQVYQSALEQLNTSEMVFQEIETIIEKTLAALPPRCRQVFILSRLEGKKNHEVAKELNISVKAVEAQITKALKVFKDTLKDFLPLLAWLLMP